jgi:heme-degrading monooxygenase HmoA
MPHGSGVRAFGCADGLVPLEGLLFDAGVGEGDDFFTISVWESPEAYDAFASGFKEAVGAAGLEGGAPQILPVHHTIDHGVPA